MLNKNSELIKTENGAFTITGQDYKEFPTDPVMKESISLTVETTKLLINR